MVGCNCVIYAIILIFLIYMTLYYVGERIKSLLIQLVKWLGYRILKNREEIWKALNRYVQKAYGGWTSILKTAIERGYEPAKKVLRAVKDEVVKICRENQLLQKFLSDVATMKERVVKSAQIQETKLVVKQVVRGAAGQVAAIGAKEGAKKVAEQVAKAAAVQGVKEVAGQVAKTGAMHGVTQAVKAGVKEGAEQVAKAAAKELGEQVAKTGIKEIAEQAAKAGVKEGAEQVAKVFGKELGEQVLKAGVKEGAEQAAKAVAIQGVKEGAEQVAKTAAKKGVKAATAHGTGILLKAATPVGIVADVAQAALECAGYKSLGKKVGCGGNIAAGAMMGSAVGPPGMVLGALGGFLLWGVGEAVGCLIDESLK